MLPQNFDYETNFTTAKTVLIVPVEIDGVAKNFLFDTGADVSLIQRDSTEGKRGSITGASNREVEFGSEVVGSLRIGPVDFRNTVAGNGDLVGLKEQIPNFGGIIGQPVISKANWLIDYPNQTLRITNEDLADSSFQTIRIKRKGGAPYTVLTVDGIEQEVVIDFGSSSAFNLPEDSDLAQHLMKQYEFDGNTRDRYTLGGLQTIKEQIGTVPSIKLGDTEFTDVRTTINVSSQPRIGISLFKDCKVYIDNAGGSYKIRQ